MQKQTPAKMCKDFGLKDFSEMIRLSHVPRGTLKGWFNDRPEVFEVMLLGCIMKRNMRIDRQKNTSLLRAG